MKELVGKTIKSVTKLKEKDFDDDCYLLLEFEDGSNALITAGYSEYTGKSKDEYKAYIEVTSLPNKHINLKKYEAVK